MDDRNVEHLLRMAGEAEELERSALETGVHLHLLRDDGTIVVTERQAGVPRNRWITGLGALGALAATFALASLFLNRSTPTFPQPVVVIHTPSKHLPLLSETTSVKGHPADVALAEADEDYDFRDVTHWEQLFNRPIAKSQRAKPGEQSMVLVIYKGKDDRCTCVEPAEEFFEIGRDYARVPRSELLSVGLNGSCVQGAGQNSDRMLVFGLTGPGDSLPRSQAAAAALASCIASPEHGETDTASYAAQAACCLPANVRVVAETMSLAKR
jgi:hypothetical protein